MSTREAIREAQRSVRDAPTGLLGVAILVGLFAGMTAVVGVLRLTGTLPASPSANLLLGPVAGPLVVIVLSLLCLAGAVLLVGGRPVGRTFCLIYLGLVTLQGLWAFSRGEIGSMVGVILAVTAIGYLVSGRTERWLRPT